MRKFKVGLIRVLTTDDEQILFSHQNQIMEKFPGLEIETKCIPDQPEGIHSKELEAAAVPKILKTAELFDSPDMLIVSCADDPGVKELREKYPHIPITGGGETTLALAMRYGEKIGILGITDYLPKAYVRIPEENRISARPSGVESTLDLLTTEGWDNALKTGDWIRSKGAQVIALACTGFATIGLAGELEKRTGLPVIDPVMAEGLFAYYECIKKAKAR